jgi:hypothetical protein
MVIGKQVKREKRQRDAHTGRQAEKDADQDHGDRFVHVTRLEPILIIANRANFFFEQKGLTFAGTADPGILNAVTGTCISSGLPRIVSGSSLHTPWSSG